MLDELKMTSRSLGQKLEEIKSHLDLDLLENRVKELEEQTCSSDFWNDREKAETILNELTALKRRLESWKKLFLDYDDTLELIQLAESDDSWVEELSNHLTSTEKLYEELRLIELLNGEFDKADAYLTIHSGAGGTEACDWVSMLYRMYMRWAETQGLKTELLDILEAEGGLKSVTVQVKGLYAYGYLKSESGIHRLVRISPFDSNARRHTSFASVYVSPVMDETIEIDIRPEDLRVDTYRSSGAGGQHVNTTDSAVRITHIPTGTVVQCQNERSQIKNRATAMNILRSRLYDLYKKEKDEEKEKQGGEKKDISWGNQIRSYVFQPYTMVKDHRTKHEKGNILSVMDGQITEFMEAFLKWSAREDAIQ